MEMSRQPGSLIADRYRILARIGEGGFGTVYKARDRQQHGRVVAIKEINMAALSAQEKIEVTDTFNREISMLSQLSHKNLPHIFDHFTDPEHWYIVMDYIEGQTLEELLAHASKGRLSVRQVVQIGIELCNVLFYLHEQKPSIIFRDVKPGNIMLTPWGHLYLIDFGIARRYRPEQLHDTGSLGSPGYAAPEQYGRARTTPQTDIYGLGATLQTLLTGKEPLEIRQQGLPPEVPIPWKLQALLIRMMDQDPVRRPRDMSEVKNALTGLNTFVAPWRFSFPLVYIAMMVLNQSGIIGSSFIDPYFVLLPFLFIGYCAFVCIRLWRTLPAGLSAKAILLISWKQVPFFVFVVILLTNAISLLYALLTHPFLTTIRAFYLWADGIFILSLLIIGIGFWLKKMRQGQKQRGNKVQVQTQPPLQQQKRR